MIRLRGRSNNVVAEYGTSLHLDLLAAEESMAVWPGVSKSLATKIVGASTRIESAQGFDHLPEANANIKGDLGGKLSRNG